MIGFYAAGAMGQGSAPPPTTWNALVASIPNLWAWWKLDETAANGVSAADASGNARPGTYTAAGTQSTGLFAGSTTRQNTIGGRINLPSYTIGATAQFSIGAMIRTSSSGVEQQILSSSTGSPQLFQWRKSMSTNALEFVVVTPSIVTITATTVVNDGNPHLGIVVVDESLAAGSGRIKLYLDGSLDGASTTALAVNTGSTSMAIGSRGNGNNTGQWAGALDEVFWVDRAITSTEVAALWAARNSP